MFSILFEFVHIIFIKLLLCRYLHIRRENIYESQQPYRLDNKFFKSNKDKVVELKNIKKDDLKGLNNETFNKQKSDLKSSQDAYESKYENIENSAQVYEEVNEQVNKRKY